MPSHVEHRKMELLHMKSQQHLMKKRFGAALRRLVMNGRPGKWFFRYLGCTPEQFQANLNRQMPPAFTIGNYGKDWELAHLAPLTLFDQTDEDDLRLCWSHVNVVALPVDIARSRLVWVDFALAELAIRKTWQPGGEVAGALKARLLASAERLRQYQSPAAEAPSLVVGPS